MSASPLAAQALPNCPRALALDSEAIAEEAVCLLRHYIALDTTNPPGNEAIAVSFQQAFLSREGIESSVVASEAGRQNLMARLPAQPAQHAPAGESLKALMLVHHMDVVPASASEWRFPPLSATVADGHIWGRGALDNKSAGIFNLMTLALAKRLSLPIPRDLVYLAVADEEAGSAHGARFLMGTHRGLFSNVAYVLNEGGAIIDVDPGKVAYRVEVAQKAPLWLRLRVRGPSGHGSTPQASAATHVLARALGRLERHSFPIRIVPAVAAFFAAEAHSHPAAEQAGYRDLARALKKPAFARAFLADPHRASLVRNTVAITMLSGSDKENVIAPEATAVLDLRLLPGEDPAQIEAELHKVMAEPAVEVETLLSWQAHASAPDNPLFAAITALAQKNDPGSPVVPAVIGGYTDCNAFRAAGMICHGFLPIRLHPSLFGGLHGKDERIPVAALAPAVRNLVELVQSVR